MDEREGKGASQVSRYVVLTKKVANGVDEPIVTYQVKHRDEVAALCECHSEDVARHIASALEEYAGGESTASPEQA